MVIGMKLNEMRSVRMMTMTDFSVTAAAKLLHATQPGISRHLIDVEKSLGVLLFQRQKNRLIGLTAAGKALLPLMDSVLNQVDDLHRIAQRFAASDRGSLCVASSQTHARYLLPSAIERFIGEFPHVDVRMRQGDLNQIAHWVGTGEADLSVSAALPYAVPNLLLYDYGELFRVLVVPQEHPLRKIAPLTLADIAQFPIITYEQQFAAHAQIMGAFSAASLYPRIALTTSDTDTMKTYARCGLGVAIVADPAFDPVLDMGLASIDARHLFPPARMYLGVKKDRPISVHVLKFIELIAPELRSKIAPEAAPFEPDA